jgi:hypothetical protein
MNSLIKTQYRHSIQIEISEEKLESLFVTGQLCAAEFKCLNSNSEQLVWSICLYSCLKSKSKLVNSKCRNNISGEQESIELSSRIETP